MNYLGSNKIKIINEMFKSFINSGYQTLSIEDSSKINQL